MSLLHVSGHYPVMTLLPAMCRTSPAAPPPSPSLAHCTADVRQGLRQASRGDLVSWAPIDSWVCYRTKWFNPTLLSAPENGPAGLKCY